MKNKQPNTTIWILSISLLACQVFFSCNLEKVSVSVDAVADFSPSENVCTAPCTITFSNTSEGAVSYLWTFGDGDSSTTKDPSHTYKESGSYIIVLKAFDSQGKSAQKSDTILVNDNILIARFEIDSITNNGYAPCMVFLKNTSQNASQFNWTFGNGSGDIVENPGPIEYQNPGTYTITLIAKNGNPSEDKTYSQEIVIKQLNRFTYQDPTDSITIGYSVGELKSGEIVALGIRRNGKTGNIENWEAYQWRFDSLGNFIENKSYDCPSCTGNLGRSLGYNVVALSDGSYWVIIPGKIFRYDSNHNSLPRVDLDWSRIAIGTRAGGVAMVWIENKILHFALFDANANKIISTQNTFDNFGSGNPSLWALGNIRQIEDGSFIICGESEVDQEKPFMIRISEEGNLVWAKEYPNDISGARKTRLYDLAYSSISNKLVGVGEWIEDNSASNQGYWLEVNPDNGNYIGSKVYEKINGNSMAWYTSLFGLEDQLYVSGFFNVSNIGTPYFVIDFNNLGNIVQKPALAIRNFSVAKSRDGGFIYVGWDSDGGRLTFSLSKTDNDANEP